MLCENLPENETNILLLLKTIKIMTILEAFDLTMEKVEEIRERGIEVTIKSRDAEEKILPVYNDIIFKTPSNLDSDIVNEAANYLGMCGITFDTSGCKGYREWQIDWSFGYTGTEDQKWRKAREDIEKMIKGIDKCSTK